MKRAKRTVPIQQASPRGGLRWLLPSFATLVLAAGLLFGLKCLGDETLRRIGNRERFQVRFADIRCDSPKGTNRETFLAEVRYVANFPETFEAFSEPAHERLHRAFSSHPAVEEVDAIRLEPGPVVSLSLMFRTAILMVRCEDGTLKFVDQHGILLAGIHDSTGISELISRVGEPKNPIGTTWNDNIVRAALDLTKQYHPRSLELTPNGWRLTQMDGKILNVGRTVVPSERASPPADGKSDEQQ